jgi:hypothetical protein
VLQILATDLAPNGTIELGIAQTALLPVPVSALVPFSYQRELDRVHAGSAYFVVYVKLLAIVIIFDVYIKMSLPPGSSSESVRWWR